MKKFKRLCVAALSAILCFSAAGIFAGCTNGGGKDLSILFPLTDMDNATLNDNYNTKLIEEITGYTVTYNQLRGGNEESEAQTSLTHQDKNHIIKLGIGSFDALVGKDLFLDLTDLIDQHGPNIKAAITQDRWETVKLNGRIMGIPEVGFAPMQDIALVVNRKHLAGLGKYAEDWLPETVSDFTALLADFKAAYGVSGATGFKGTDYRAFGLPGTMPDCSLISAAFDLPYEFYEDSEGKVQNMIYSDEYSNYTHYMNSLYSAGYMRTDWSSMLAANITRDFANGKYSIAVMSYWDIKAMAQQMAASDSTIANEAAAMNNINYTIGIRGDGTNNTPVQEKAKHRGRTGNAYILTIPFYMESEAVKAIDYIDKKLAEESLIKFLTGAEGETYELSDASDPDAIKVTYNSDKVQHGTKYYKLLPLYADIQRNSIYGTGNNSKISEAFWPLRGTSYGVWDIIVRPDVEVITSVMASKPILLKWAPQQIKSTSEIFTFLQAAINETSADNVDKRITQIRTSFASKYWTDEISTEVNTWYSSRA